MTQGYSEVTRSSNNIVVEDFHLIDERWVGGTRRRLYMNSQGYLRNEGYTPEEANACLIDLCRAVRDGDLPNGKELRLVASIPDQIVNQLWVEHGFNVLEDDDMLKKLVLNNPDFSQLRTSKGRV